MRVATERAKLVRGITASFKKLSRSSEVSLACHALPDMMLHCSAFHCSDQAALMPAACSCASLQEPLTWQGSISCVQIFGNFPLLSFNQSITHCFTVCSAECA